MCMEALSNKHTLMVLVIAISADSASPRAQVIIYTKLKRFELETAHVPVVRAFPRAGQGIKDSYSHHC